MTAFRILPLLSLLTLPVVAQDIAIPLELPPPRYYSGPVIPIDVEHLRPPRGRARPPFFAPTGTTNVARGKPVTSSDDFPVVGKLDFVTDGVKHWKDNRRPASDAAYIEIGPGLQWVQIDLGKPTAIHAILFWQFHFQRRVYHDVIVQIADDAEATVNRRILFNNDHDNTAGFGPGKDPAYIESNEGELIDAKGQVARFVRIHSRGNTSNEMNHFVEVEVFGIPVPEAPAE